MIPEPRANLVGHVADHHTSRLGDERGSRAQHMLDQRQAGQLV
jgi:hypothetical protein